MWKQLRLLIMQQEAARLKKIEQEEKKAARLEKKMWVPGSRPSCDNIPMELD